MSAVVLVRVALGLFAYVVLALVASWAVRRSGRDLKNMEARTSARVVLIGAVANLGILAVALALVRLLLGSPLEALRLSFDRIDLAFTASVSVLLGVLAVVYVRASGRSEGITVETSSPTAGGVGSMLSGWALLLIVALQEEVLFRGYMTASLRGIGPVGVVVVTTALFAGVHVLTNRVSLHQMLSWVIGGAILAYAYLSTGTLWVPVALHFATDMINVLVFDIVGRWSVFRITPSLTPAHRTGYRVVYALALVAMLLAFYGPHLAYDV